MHYFVAAEIPHAIRVKTAYRSFPTGPPLLTDQALDVDGGVFHEAAERRALYGNDHEDDSYG